MSPTPYIKELLSIAIHLAESLSERIPKSSSLQRNCNQIATNLRKWRQKLPSEMEFLLKPTGEEALYKSILSLLSELLCILCQLIWTAHELGQAPSLATITRTTDAVQKISAACPSVKKFQDSLGVWQKPRKGQHAPLAVLFDPAVSRRDERFVAAESAVNGHVGVCCGGLTDAGKKVERAWRRHLGLRLLAGKAA